MLLLLTVFQAAAVRRGKRPVARGDDAGADMSEYRTACDWRNGPEYKDLAYGSATCGEGSAEGCNQLYDLLTTSAALRAGAVPVPLAVFIHGGSWKMGDKKDLTSQEFLALRQRGMHVASINYRLSPDVAHPTHADDVKAAIAHFKSAEFVETYNIDPKRIFLFGSSAGGHLASFVGMTEQIPAVNFYGVVGLFKNWGAITGMLNCTTPTEEGTACHELAKEASPATYVSSASPPLLSFYGTGDLSYQSGVDLQEAGKNANADFALVTVQCSGAMRCHRQRAMLTGTTDGICNADYMYKWLYQRLNWHATGCAKTC